MLIVSRHRGGMDGMHTKCLQNITYITGPIARQAWCGRLFVDWGFIAVTTRQHCNYCIFRGYPAKWPYLSCVSMAGRALLAGYPRLYTKGVGRVGGFSKLLATFSHVGGSFNLFMATTVGVWIIPSFRILGFVLHVEHISCVIRNCGQHLWDISPLFSSSWGLTGGKHYQKITIATFRFVFQFFFTNPCYFPYIFFCRYLFSLFFSLVCYCSVWLYFSQGTS